MNKKSERVGTRRMEAMGNEMIERSNFEEGESSRSSKLKHLNLASFVMLIA